MAVKIDNRKLRDILAEEGIRAMREIVMPVFLDVAKSEYSMNYIHPAKWKESIINGLKIGEVRCNSTTMAFEGNLTLSGEEWLWVRAGVLEDGNNMNGPLWTAPGKESWNAELDGRHVQDHTIRGRPVVWVHNTNPNLEKTITYTSKKTGQIKNYKVKVGKFYPLFKKTLLPKEFNITPSEAAHVYKNIQVRMNARYDELVTAWRNQIANACRRRFIEVLK